MFKRLLLNGSIKPFLIGWYGDVRVFSIPVKAQSSEMTLLVKFAASYLAVV